MANVTILIETETSEDGLAMLDFITRSLDAQIYYNGKTTPLTRLRETTT